ncbi:MAG: SRPBCC domain-containing protein [Myxococcota bacterium]
MSALHIEPEGERSLRIVRRFAAPRTLVFEAHLRPELVVRWLGITRMDWVRCEIDARPGGRFHYEWARDGHTLAEEGPRATRLEMRIDYGSGEIRDRVLAGPMSAGLGEGYDALDTVLASTIRPG